MERVADPAGHESPDRLGRGSGRRVDTRGLRRLGARAMDRPVAAVIIVTLGALIGGCSAAPATPPPVQAASVQATPTTAPTPTPVATPTTAPTSTPVATPTTAPTSTPVATRSPDASIPGLTPGNSTAGTYRTLLQPEVRLTLPEGWGLFFDEPGGTYLQIPGGEFLVGRPEKVVDPSTGKPLPVPEDLLKWLVEHPRLNSTDPTSIKISGHSAGYVDVAPAGSTDVFYDPLGNFHVGPGRVARFYVIPWVGPDIFVGVMVAPSGDLDAALSAGVPIVRSIKVVE